MHTHRHDVRWSTFESMLYKNNSWYGGEDCNHDIFLLSISCLSVFLHYLGFACYLPLSIFLLRNNLFLYQVRCTTIFHRRNLDSFLYQCSDHGKIAAWVRILCPPLYPSLWQWRKTVEIHAPNIAFMISHHETCLYEKESGLRLWNMVVQSS